MIASYNEQILSLQKEVAHREESMKRGRARIQGRRREGAALVYEVGVMRAILGTVEYMERIEPVLKQLKIAATKNRRKCVTCDSIAKLCEDAAV